MTPPQLITEAQPDAFNADDRCCLEQLRQHLEDNAAYYDRAIWLMEDPNERARRFEGVVVGGAPLLDLIENRALEVIGDMVAFPTTDEGAETEPSVVDVLKRHKAEELLSFPVRGAFAEAKLGHCNASEQFDITRFWDWSESPCPEAPDIAPVQAVTPTAQQPNLQPSTLPNSIVNIVNPPAAPDPTGLANALSVLGTPNIFRDMSGRQELATLLGQLAGGAVGLGEAQQKAREILAKEAGQNAAAPAGSGRGSEGSSKIPSSEAGKVAAAVRNDPNVSQEQKQQIIPRIYKRAAGLPDEPEERALTIAFKYQVGATFSILDGEFSVALGDPFHPTSDVVEQVSTIRGVGRILNPRVEPGGAISITGAPRSPVVTGPDLRLNFGSTIGNVDVPFRRFVSLTMPELSGSLGTWNFAAGKRLAVFDAVAPTVTTVIEIEVDVSVSVDLGVKIAEAVEAEGSIEGLLKLGVKPGVNLEGLVKASVGGKVKIPFEAIALAPNNPLEIKQTS
jgi:hypothetical protein